jgi:hypothetical protein
LLKKKFFIQGFFTVKHLFRARKIEEFSFCFSRLFQKVSLHWIQLFFSGCF